MRVLGIDPGLRITGYGCVESDGISPRLIEAGVFRLGLAARASRTGACETAELKQEAPVAAGAAADPRPRVSKTTPDARTVSARLVELDHDFRELLTRLRPGVVAVESLFSHYNHPATAIVMGHARGVLLLAIKQHGLRLMEFKPNLVKKSVTGHGLAAKGQVQRAIQAQFNLAEPPQPPDVADALAIALCASRRLALGLISA